MAKKTPKAEAPIGNGANLGYEAQLWQMADALRRSIDAAKYSGTSGARTKCRFGVV